MLQRSACEGGGWGVVQANVYMHRVHFSLPCSTSRVTHSTRNAQCGVHG